MHWWLIIGAALLALELLLIDAQFYLVFLGLAAMATGFALWAGLPSPAVTQWLLFAILALLFTFVFRKRLYAAMRREPDRQLDSPFETGTAIPAAPLAPGEEGPVQHRGSQWTGRNIGATALAPGTPAYLRGRDGLVLLLDAAAPTRSQP
jgi:membrane protein implicated in regulation of membrane protease activity